MQYFIALDWGTTSLRAYLMDGEGRVLAERSGQSGILHLPAPGGLAGFHAAFNQICGDWLAQGPLPVVASGMVGSAQGWAEAPYVRCPANISQLATQAARVALPGGGEMLIAPGLLLDSAGVAPDVMRGEEIQIAGALASLPGLAGPDDAAPVCVVLPGTHSKWVRVQAGTVTDFATYMTGEVFALLSKHSILNRLMTDAATTPPDLAEAGFHEGVQAARRARPGELTHQLFAVRTLGLTGKLPQAALRDYLSGLLIGQEMASAPARLAEGGALPETLLLIGEPALCARYRTAMQEFGITCTAVLENTAPAGLYRFALAAGLLGPAAITKDQSR